MVRFQQIHLNLGGSLILSAVIQNNLQYVAATNLEAATFQVTYQMKILTTAGFSVLLLRKTLSATKWVALLFLAIGVGIVQLDSGASKPASSQEGVMNPLTGFLAVFAACFTSGLAGVYFEVVLKNSQSDLWVRNLQLSVSLRSYSIINPSCSFFAKLFSFVPAFIPIAYDLARGGTTDIFHNFGVSAWCTVGIQVLGGLITAMVIKYADNILKCFATSLSIILSCLVSVAAFSFPLTTSFVVGAGVVLAATWMYNQSDCPKTKDTTSPLDHSIPATLIPLSRVPSSSSVFSSTSFSAMPAYLETPREKSGPLLTPDFKVQDMV